MKYEMIFFDNVSHILDKISNKMFYFSFYAVRLNSCETLRHILVEVYNDVLFTKIYLKFMQILRQILDEYVGAQEVEDEDEREERKKRKKLRTQRKWLQCIELMKIKFP